VRPTFGSSEHGVINQPTRAYATILTEEAGSAQGGYRRRYVEQIERSDVASKIYVVKNWADVVLGSRFPPNQTREPIAQAVRGYARTDGKPGEMFIPPVNGVRNTSR
jgi:hypothetical protein